MGSLPGFRRSIISAVLSAFGQWCVLSIPLKMYNSVRSPFLGSSLSICGVTRSGPGDFLLLSLCISSRTSWRVRGMWFGGVCLDWSCCVISASGLL